MSNEIKEVFEGSFDFLRVSDNDVMMMNPLVWAYVGDAVYEVYVRSYIISNHKRSSNDLHKESIKYVKAAAQSKVLEEILPMLTEEEQNIARRGRNTKTYHVPKNANMIDYRRATAFEALIGYLYLMKRFDRINEIVKIAFK